MVTPEERITRLEAAQEFNAQQFSEVLSRLNHILTVVEAARQEAREMNEAARQEAREMNEATRQEAREANEATRREAREANEVARKEARESIEAARKDARNLFIASLTIGATVSIGLGAGIITLLFRVLERLPG